MSNRLYLLVGLLLTAPFYLNDFANIFIRDWRWWLFIDYTATKLFPFFVVLWLISRRKITLTELGLSHCAAFPFLVTVVVVTLLATLIDQNAYHLIRKLPGYAPIAGMPPITNYIWNWVDLTLGLLLVGIFEELVFRSYLAAAVRRYTQNPAIAIVASSVVFGSIHWSLGLHAVIVTTIIGIVFMLGYQLTRSIPAIMVSHFAVNFIDFAGVIPKSIFKLY